MRIQIIAISSVICLVLALTLTVRRCRTTQADRDRLLQNQSHMLHNGHVEISTTANGSSLATAPAIVLKSSEFRQSADPMPRLAKDMGSRPSRIREAATAAAVTRASLTLSLTPSTQASDTSALSSFFSLLPFILIHRPMAHPRRNHPPRQSLHPSLREGEERRRRGKSLTLISSRETPSTSLFTACPRGFSSSASVARPST